MLQGRETSQLFIYNARGLSDSIQSAGLTCVAVLMHLECNGRFPAGNPDGATGTTTDRYTM